MKNRIQTKHPNGSEAVAPFIALSENEINLYDGTGILYAVIKGNQIVAVFKKPPIDQKIVSRDDAIKNAGVKGWCKTAKFEYDRLIRDEKIREFKLTNEWHKKIIESGNELWRGVFSTTHFCEPKKQEYIKIPSLEISTEQAETIKAIVDYLEFIHTPLQKECTPVDFDRRATLENYIKLSPLNMAIKNLNDFLKHIPSS